MKTEKVFVGQFDGQKINADAYMRRRCEIRKICFLDRKFQDLEPGTYEFKVIKDTAPETPSKGALICVPIAVPGEMVLNEDLCYALEDPSIKLNTALIEKGSISRYITRDGVKYAVYDGTYRGLPVCILKKAKPTVAELAAVGGKLRFKDYKLVDQNSGIYFLVDNLKINVENNFLIIDGVPVCAIPLTLEYNNRNNLYINEEAGCDFATALYIEQKVKQKLLKTSDSAISAILAEKEKLEAEFKEFSQLLAWKNVQVFETRLSQETWVHSASQDDAEFWARGSGEILGTKFVAEDGKTLVLPFVYESFQEYLKYKTEIFNEKLGDIGKYLETAQVYL